MYSTTAPPPNPSVSGYSYDGRRHFRCDTRPHAVATTLLVARWIAGAMVFAAIIVSWVFNASYASVWLGIVTLFALGLMVLADIPGIRLVPFLRTTFYGLNTASFLRMGLFLCFIALCTPREYFLNQTGAYYSAASYSIAASVIMAVVGIVHIVAWAAYFRLNNDPELHWGDIEAATAAPTTVGAGTYATTAAPAGGFGTTPSVLASDAARIPTTTTTTVVPGQAPPIVTTAGFEPAQVIASPPGPQMTV